MLSQGHKKNSFTVLADSDSENDFVEQSFQNSNTVEPTGPPPPFRTWARDESEGRFSGEDVRRNIFSSPFSKHKNPHKQWIQAKARDNSSEWVSIRWNQPLFQDESDEEKEEKQEGTDFPSLIKKVSTNTGEGEALSAVGWAEKIKKSLEKAELARAVKTKEVSQRTNEILGRLSFFRRPMIIGKSDE